MASKKQHKNLPKYEDYRESIIAFIDVLGFSHKSDNIKDESIFSQVSILLYALKKYENLYDNITVTAVSDSIIFTMPHSDNMCIHQFIHAIRIMQYNALATDVKTLLRGYIAKGPVYHKGGIIFGKGYNYAYKEENKIGDAPIIVIDIEIIEEAQKARKDYQGEQPTVNILDYIRKDDEKGMYFIDYLAPEPKQKTDYEYLKERDDIKSFVQKI